MKTTKIYQQASTMLGAVILVLTVLLLLFMDIKYLTSSIRIIFVISSVVGGLLLMTSMTTKTTVEVTSENILPVKELTQQQKRVHQSNITRLNNLLDNTRRLELVVVRPDDIEALDNINFYLLEQLGREQNMSKALGLEVEEILTINPITGDKFWYLPNGTPYTISMKDYNIKSTREKDDMKEGNKIGLKVRG